MVHVVDPGFKSGLAFGRGHAIDFASLAVLPPWLVDDGARWVAFADTSAGTIGRVRVEAPLAATGIGDSLSTEEEPPPVILMRGLDRPVQVCVGQRDMGGIFVLEQGRGGGRSCDGSGRLIFLMCRGKDAGRWITLCENLSNPRGLCIGKDMGVWFVQYLKGGWSACHIRACEIKSSIGSFRSCNLHSTAVVEALRLPDGCCHKPEMEPIRLCMSGDGILFVAFRYWEKNKGCTVVGKMAGAISFWVPVDFSRRSGSGTPRKSNYIRYEQCGSRLLAIRLPPIRDMLMGPTGEIYIGCCGIDPSSGGALGVGVIKSYQERLGALTAASASSSCDAWCIAAGNVQAIALVHATQHVIFAEARAEGGCVAMRKGVSAAERVRRMSKLARISVPEAKRHHNSDSREVQWSKALVASASVATENEPEAPLFNFETGEEEQLPQNIKVIARCRPLIPREVRLGGRSAVSVNQRTQEVVVSSDATPLGKERHYAFDKVYGEDASQERVYRDILEPMVHRVLDGFNASVLCYGQTSSGKTWTMEGGMHGSHRADSHDGDPTDLGLIPRAVHTIFESMKRKPLASREHFIYVSHTEIYNERVFDLLHDEHAQQVLHREKLPTISPVASRGDAQRRRGPPPALRLSPTASLRPFSAPSTRGHRSPYAYSRKRQPTGLALSPRASPYNLPMSPSAVRKAPQVQQVLGLEVQDLKIENHPELGVVVKGSTQILVDSPEQIFDIMRRSSHARKTAETLCNAASSRSHAIFTVRVISCEPVGGGEENVRDGVLNLVDLSGSENIKRSGAEVGSIRAREAARIGQSLLSLGRVIHALVERATHIPYRESKLTRLLCNSLGGNSLTALILNVTPNHAVMDETISTLAYAALARSVRNKPKQCMKRRAGEGEVGEGDGTACVDSSNVDGDEDNHGDGISGRWKDSTENSVVRPWSSSIPFRAHGEAGPCPVVARPRRRVYDGPAAEWSFRVMSTHSTKSSGSEGIIGVTLTQPARSVLSQIFSKYDGNKDGRLERHEVAMLHAEWISRAAGVPEAAGAVKRAVANRLLDKHMRDCSVGGRLSLDLFLEFTARLAEEDPASLRALVQGSGFSLSLKPQVDEEAEAELETKEKPSAAVNPVTRCLTCSKSEGWLIGPDRLWAYM